LSAIVGKLSSEQGVRERENADVLLWVSHARKAHACVREEFAVWCKQ
jgi:hypothetical protein